MKLTYLGTAAAEGWPALYCNCPSCEAARDKKGKNIRTRSQSLVNDDLLIDFPPDTYLHVLNYGLDLNKVSNVLITHAHEDHLYIEDFACRLPGYTNTLAKPLIDLYGNDAVAKRYEWCNNLPWNKELPSVIAMHQIEAYQPISVGHYLIHPMLADHNPLERCFIYAVTDQNEGKTLLYAHDTGYLREDVWAYMKEQKLQFDLVSLDCTNGSIEDFRNHMGIQGDRMVKERLIQEGLVKENCIFALNHFSHNCKIKTHEEIEDLVAGDHFLVAYDSMQISF